MSALWVEPLATLIKTAVRVNGLTTCVETGTGHGTSTFWAAGVFDQIATMEINEESRHTAIARHPGLTNVDFLFGSSRSVLPGVVAALAGPAFFWLDAHSAFGEASDCPILDELEIINRSPHQHYIVVDDADCFSGIEPQYQSLGWPTVTAILAEAKRLHPYYHVVAHGVIVIMPHHMSHSIDLFQKTPWPY